MELCFPNLTWQGPIHLTLYLYLPTYLPLIHQCQKISFPNEKLKGPINLAFLNPSESCFKLGLQSLIFPQIKLLPPKTIILTKCKQAFTPLESDIKQDCFIICIHENKIRGGMQMKQMLGICNGNDKTLLSQYLPGTFLIKNSASRENIDRRA